MSVSATSYIGFRFLKKRFLLVILLMLHIFSGFSIPVHSMTVKGMPLVSFLENSTIGSPAPPPLPVCEGNSISLQVFTGTTWKWQESIGGGPFADIIPLQVTPILNLSGITLAMDGNQYLCVIDGVPSGTIYTLDVLPLPVASINYAASPFCQTGIATVTQTGQTGGTYSSSAGLTIDASTGQIDLALSTPGNYTVTYSFTNGTCPNTTTASVTINPLPAATISYSGSPYCKTGVANVTLVGTPGGSFSSTPGLSITSSTGAINLAASTPGTYVVTYSFTDGTCINSVTTNVTISAPPTATIVYAGDPFCQTGTAFVTLTGPTGGTYSSSAGLSINGSTGAINLVASTPGTYTVEYAFSNGTCSNTTTTSVTIISLPLGLISYTGNPYCRIGTATVTQSGPTGGTYTSTAGLSLDAITGTINLATSTAGTYIVTYSFTDGTCPNSTTTNVTINTLPTATISYTGSPYCQTGTASVTQTGQAGGIYSSTAGLSINSSTGEVDLVASTVGSYVVTYNFSNGDCSSSVSTNLTINALPTASISYAGSPYCATGTALVTRTGSAIGTYSSTAGLSINSSTGAINLGASTPGTYVVTYSFTDSTCPNTTSTSVTINNVPSATISYAGSPYCMSGVATVTLSGPAGGTYTSTAGLSITSSNGSINLAASSPGTYLVTYSFTDGTCSSIATTVVTVLALPSATINYSGSPYCQTGVAIVTLTGSTGGTYSSTAGLSINSTTGAINLAASAAGTYTVTYSYSNGTCSNTATTTVTISSLPTALINYTGNPYCKTGTAIVTQTGQIGGIYTSSAGLSLNSTTGAIDLGASTAGSYTVTYSFTNGVCTNNTSTSITINSLPIASISYTGSPYCQTGIANVTQAGQAGGTYSSTAGLSINPATGAIDLAASTVGSYTVTYSFSDGTCPNSTTASVVINPLPIATISYSGNPYCQTGTALVTQTGQAGGTYTSTAGLTINSITGEISLASSVVGTYTVTYNYTNGSCSNVAVTSVTINPLPVATIIYAGSPYCKSGVATVTQTGPTGGTYSSTAGLSINSTTGAVDLVASSAGTYTVTYLFTNGTCPNTTTTTITISAPPTATISYSGNPYCKIGTATVTQTGPIGGTYSSTPGLSINSITGEINLGSSTAGTYTVMYSFTNGTCSNTVTTSVTINSLPTALISYTGTPYCKSGVATVTQSGPAGGIYSSTAGLSINSSTGAIDLVSSTAGSYTVTYSFTNGTCANTTTTALTINTLPTATISYTGSPYCHVGTASVTQTGQAGGTYSSTAGLSINPVTGSINLAASTVGSYTVTYSFTDGTCPNSTTAVVVINPLPTATISYSGNPFCQTGTAIVTQTGQTGGTYSSTAGISINAVTGEINLAASSVGTYTVTYSFANGACSNTTTTIVTINTLPTATISYAGSPYCKSGTATVTQSGPTGGTYISTVGLSIDPLTGAIDLSSSNAGTYTVTYNFSNGTCLNSTTTTLTINPLPTATISYSGNPFCKIGTATVTQTGPPGGTYSSTAGLSINSSTGAINLAASAAGTYTVTYNFTDGVCLGTTSTNVTINLLPVATITYTGTPYCKSGTANVTQTGQTGGSYSSTAGLSINSTTGAIDLSASTPGIYTVTYSFTNGPCVNTASASVTINPLPTATISYTGIPYCQTGTATVIQTGQGGGVYTSTIGLSINSSTGSINLAASTPGTYTVTYSFTDGTCPSTTTASVNIIALPSASINYAGNPYCQTGSAVVTQTGQTGGTYSSTAGLSLNPSTGEINLVASTPGTYTVTYNFTNGTCPNSTTTSVTINPPSTASITYSGSPYCQTGTATVTQTGSTGGTYTSTAGLIITPSNGSIDLAASTPGTYTVTYSFTNGICPGATTTSVIINALPTATIVYPGNPFCNTGTVAVTQTGPSGGTFSSSAGLSISATTGTINLASSTPGTYTVTYSFTNGTCNNSVSTPVTINPLPTALISYTGNPYCKTGTANVTQTGPTGGTYSSTAGLSINPLTGVIDLASSTAGNYLVRYSFSDGTCSNSTTTSITINPLPVAAISYAGSPYCQTGTANVIQTGPVGGTYSSTSGLSINSLTGAIDLTSSTAGNYVVSYSFTDGVCSNTTSTTVIINPLPIASINYADNPYCKTGTANVTQTGQIGGIYTSTAGLSINSLTGAINLAASAVGTYTVTYSFSSGPCPNSTTTSITINALPIATISYPGSPYCKTGTATVSQTGPTGGNYSSTAGLSISPSSGTIDLASSTPGTYTVTYSFSNGTCSNTATTTITIVPLPTASIVYAGNPYCQIGTAVVSQSGPSGGTYSSTPGLSINSLTGSINLALSTPGTYNVTYSFTNGSCSNTTSTSITVNSIPTALISYTSNPYCNTGTASVLQTGQTGGTYSSTPGVAINPSTGAIDLAASTAGNHTVTYNFSNGSCSGTTTANILINPLPTPAITGPSVVCADPTGDVYTTQVGMSNYNWTLSSGGSITSGANSSAITIVWTTSGTHNLHVSFTDANGCSGTSAAYPVLVQGLLPPKPDNINGNTPVCQSAIQDYSITPIPGATSYTWSVSNGTYGVLSPTTIRVTFSPSAVNGTISVYATNSCGDGPTETKSITVNPKPATPVITASGPTSFCAGGSVTLSAPTSAAYLWSNGSTTQSITVTTAGSFTVVVSDAIGCQSDVSAPKITSIIPNATVFAGADNTICEGDSYIISDATAANYFDLLWTSTGTGLFSSPGGLNPSYTPSAADIASGSVILTLRASYNAPCTGNIHDDMTLTIHPTPTISAGASQTVCYPASLTVSDAVMNNGTNPRWSLTGAGVLFNANSLTPTYQPQAADVGNTITLTLTVDPTAPCATPQVTSTKSITVYALPSDPGVITAVPGSASVCKGTTVSYSIVPFADPNVNYNWSVPPGATLVPGANPYQISVIYGTASSSGDVSVFGTNSCGNGPVSKLAVLVNDKPVNPGSINGRTDVCQGTSAEVYSITPVPGATSYVWNVSNGTFTVISPTSIRVNFGPLASVGTISVYAVNSCGNGPTATKAVTVHPTPPIPVITANGPLTFCVGGSVILSAPTGSGYSYLWSNGATSQTINVNTTGTFTVIVTDSFGCQSPVSASVTTDTTPAATVSAGKDNIICTGDTYALTDAVASNYFDLLWSSTGTGSFSVSGVQNPTYTPSAADIANGSVVLTLTASNNTPCTGDIHDDMTLTIQAVPALNMGSDLTVCYPASVTIDDVSVSNGINPIWTITSGLGNLLNANTLKPIFQPAPFLGIQTVVLTLTVDPLSPCTVPASATKRILVSSAPENAGVITAVPGAASVCIGSTVSYTITPFADPSATYHWSVPPGATLIPGANPYEISVTYGSGSSSGDVSVYGSNGCGDGLVAQLAVQVNDVPADPGIINGNSVICQGGGSEDYTITPVTGATSYTWSVSNGTFVTLAPNSIRVNFDPLAINGTISVFAQNSCGTGPVASKAITVHPTPVTPVITAGGPLSFCAGGSVLLTATAGIGYSYLWSNGATSQSIIVTTAGSYSVVVTDSYGCQSAASTVVNTFTLPAATSVAGSDAIICAGSNFTVSSATATKYSTLLWTTSGTGSFMNNGTTTPTYSPSALDINNGSVILTLNASGIAPCLTTVHDDMLLTIQKEPTVSAGSDQTVCFPSSVVLSGTAATDFQNPHWIHNGSGVLVDLNTLNPTYYPSPTDVGNTLTLTLTVDPLAPCLTAASDIMYIQVKGAPGNPGVISGPNTVCKGTTNVYWVAPIAGVTDYHWTLPSGTTIVSGANSNNIVVTFGALSESGNFTVYGSNDCGNGVLSVLPVTVNDVPANPGSIAGPSAICEGTSGVVFSVTPVTGAVNYLWTAPSGATIISTPPYASTITVDFGMGATSGNITVQAINSCGNGAVASKTIVVNSKPATPVITASGPLTFCEGGSVLLTGAPTGSIYSYLWSANGATTRDNLVTTSGDYTVIVTVNSTGCSSDPQAIPTHVVVNPAPVPPNSVGILSECVNGAIIPIDANTVAPALSGASIVWYSAPTGGVVVSPILNAIGTKIVYAEYVDNVSGCTSLTRTMITLTISMPPPAPTVLPSPPPVCEQLPIQTLNAEDYLSGPIAPGTTIYWYDAPVLGQMISPFMSSVGSKTFYAEANDGTCSSLTRSSGITLTITPAPLPPVSGGDIIQCVDPVSPMVYTPTATAPAGSVVNWYAAPVGGTPIVPSLSSAAIDKKTFYAESFDGTCNSLTRTPVTIEIVLMPDPPVDTTDPVVICETNPITSLTATASVPFGFKVNWYDAAGNLVAIPILSAVGTKDYFAESENLTSGCKSSTRTLVTLTINPAPNPPITIDPLPKCDDSTPLVASATVPSGMTVVWYANASGGTQVVPDPPSQSGPGQVTYYAEAVNTVTGCSSLTRTPQTLKIIALPADPVITGDEFVSVCATNPVQTLKASATSPDGTPIKWYILPAGGVPVADPKLNTVGSVDYYAEADNGTCQSKNRAHVKLTISPVPLPPTYIGDLTLCQSDPDIPVDLSTRVNSGGLNVQWFNEPTGGEPLDHIPNVSSDGVSVYYAGTIDGVSGCQSLTRTTVTVTINSKPADPVWISDQTECLENPAQVLRASVDVPVDGATITWYDSPTGGNLVNSPILNHVGTISYWAQANLGQCTSANRTMVTLTIEDVPVPPVLSGASNELVSCETAVGINANDAIVVAPMTTIKWFDKSIDGVEVSPIQIAAGERLVYAEAVYIGSGCSSLARTAVKLTVLQAPAAPVSTGDIIECAQNPLQVLDANKSISPAPGTSIVWYNQPSGGLAIANPTLNVANSTAVYYAESVDNITTCTSLTRTAVKLSLISITASAASNSPLSLGQTLQLKGGPDVPGNTFVWTDPNGFNFFTMDVIIPNVTEAAAGKYKLTVTSPAGCSATDSVIVLLDIARAEAQLPVCIGSTLYLSGYPDNMKSYAWSGPNGFTSSEQNPSINNVSIVNSGVYTLIVTNSNNATSSDTVSVSFKPLPIPIAEATTVCPAGTLQLKAGPNGMTSYTWSDQNGSTWNQQNPPAIPYPNPPQTFKLTVVDWNGCEASKTITPVPFQPKATSNSPVCGGDTLRLRGEPNGMASYKWTGPNGFVSNLQSPTLNNANPATATGDYTLTVVDKAGCTFSTKVTVSFYASVPIPTIVPNMNPVCEGSTLILKGGPSGMTRYDWTGPDGFISQDQNPQITNMTGVNAGKYALQITNSNGCKNVFQTDISVTTVTFNGAYGPFCVSDSPMPLSVTPSGGTFTGPGMNGNVFDPKLAGPGTHPIQYTLPGGACTVTKFIVVVTVPKLVINNPILKSCTGTTADLTLPAVTAGSTTGLFLSYWTDSNATSALVSPKSVAAGLYYIKGTTSGGKCSDIKPVMVTQPDSLRANVVISSELNCKGDSTGALTVNVTMGTAPFTYQWSTQPVQTTQTATNLPSGTYTVLVTDAKMCAAAFTGDVLAPTPLKLGFAIKSIQCMSDINGTARIDTINGITDPYILNSYTYEWDTSPVQTTREATRLSAGWQKITLTSPKGCVEKDSVYIDVLDVSPPVIDCPKDVDINVSYIKSTDGSPNKYTIKLGRPVVSDNCAIDTLYNDAPEKFRKGLTYVVWTVTDQVGLVDTCTQRVYVRELPTVPQLITPNGDGLNDTFIIDGLNGSDYKNSQMSIFTRSGQLVFQNSNYELPENAWDGKYQESTFAKNNIVAPGIYFYILKLGGSGGQMLKGYVYVYY